MNTIEEFDAAIKAKDADTAAHLWGRERISGGKAHAMVAATLVRLQREIDELKAAKE